MKGRSILDLRVRDLMSTKPLITEKGEELSKVLGMMQKNEIHEVPVVEKGNLLGMLSYSTVLKRRTLPMTTKVESLLSQPSTVRPDDHLPPVAEILMSSGYRAVPVVENSRLVGVVSRTDLVGAIATSEEFASLSVREVMTPEPQVVRQEDTALQARDVLRQLDERAIPVVNKEGKLTGVVGLKDLVKAVVRPRKKTTKGDRVGEKIPVELEVKGIMSVPPITISPDGTAAETASLMDKHKISSVVVVDEGRAIGVVTQVDLLEQVAAFRIRDQALVQIAGLDEDDWWTYEILYDSIGRGLKRIAGIVRPTILNVHVVTHRSLGDRAKYSVRARLATRNGLYVASDFDWDPHMAMQKVMNQFERRIKTEKERRVDSRKRREV